MRIPYMVWLTKFENYPLLPPKFENLHYGLWQLRSAITRVLLKIREGVCTKQGLFGVWQSNGIIQISVRPTLVAMATC